MFYEVSFLWLWLVLALIVGGVVGWRNESDGPQQPWFEGWFRVALILLGVGFVLSILGLVSGRFGFWVETAVLFFAAYLIGCFAGGAARRTGVAG
jgi:uncharacterized membrane protein